MDKKITLRGFSDFHRYQESLGIMNTEAARINMLTQQIRACDVLDNDLLDIIRNTPREIFVPEQYKQVAFAGMNIPLSHDQQMMTPTEEGNMLQALRINSDDKVLEVGTGTGYVTALLAQLANSVISLDIFSDFTINASQQLQNLGFNNVRCVTADAASGWPAHEPYDVIAITASMPFLPKSFAQHLAIGGRLFVVLGDKLPMTASLITRVAENDWHTEQLFETELTALINAPQKSAFVF